MWDVVRGTTHSSRLHVRRDHDGGNAHAEAVEIKSALAGVAGGVRSGGVEERRQVVISAAVFVIGDDQHDVVVPGRSAYSLPDLIEELLAGIYVMRRVLVIGLKQETWLNERIWRQRVLRAVILEIIKAGKMIVEKRVPQFRKHGAR